MQVISNRDAFVYKILHFDDKHATLSLYSHSIQKKRLLSAIFVAKKKKKKELSFVEFSLFMSSFNFLFSVVKRMHVLLLITISSDYKLDYYYSESPQTLDLHHSYS